jgi:hypothetical protein
MFAHFGNPMKPLVSLLALALCVAVSAHAQTPAEPPQQPYVGQPGKDVVWVPTPPTLVDRMLELAKVGPKDYVIDLGSGDGRNVIAAAKLGARALGVEYDSNLVHLSRKYAAEAGVADRARFIEGDMFEVDISKATVLALFLLPDNLARLKPKFERLRPGTRIVTNGYQIAGWEAAETAVAGGDCAPWCNAYLYIVPPH